MPLNPGIEAIYTDYGKVAPVDTPANRQALLMFFMSIQEMAAVSEKGENEYHELAFDFMDFITKQSINIIPKITGMFSRSPAKAQIGSRVFMAQARKCWDYIYRATNKAVKATLVERDGEDE